MIVVLPVGAIVAGVFALLFLLAWQQWGQSVSVSVNVNLPYIGRVLGNLITDALDYAYAVLVAVFDAAVHPVANLVLAPIAAIENEINALYQMGANITAAAQSVVWTRIPAALSAGYAYSNSIGNNVLAQAAVWVNAAKAYALSVGNNVLAQAAVWVTGAEQYAFGLATNVLNQSLAWVNAARADAAAGITVEHQFAVTAFGQAEALTKQAFDAANVYAGQLAQIAEQDIAHALTTAEAFAQTTATAAVGALATDIDNAVTGALSGIYTDIDTAIADVVGIAGTGDADILAGLRAIPVSIPLDIAGLAALTGATTLTLTRYLKECGIPNCQNLSGLGNELQALLGMVEDVAFFALFAEMIHNPDRARQLAEDAFGGVVTAATDAATALMGV